MTQHLDAWANIVTGVGGPRDKSANFVHIVSMLGSDPAVQEQIYAEDDIAGIIVDALPDQVFRRGWRLDVPDQDDLRQRVIDELDRLGLTEAIKDATRWERLFGGSAIFVGAEDGQNPANPLNLANIRKVHFLTTFDRWELTPQRYYTDPLRPNFGKPEVFRVSPQDTSKFSGLLVHESRLVRFGGVRATKRRRAENLSWGDSVLVRAYEAVRQFAGAYASTLALLADANQGIYKISGLFQALKSGNADILRERMKAIDTVRSTVNAIVLDKDEDYTRVAATLTELGNLLDKFMLRVAASARMPVTVLFGQAPAGLNATGESDMRNWYDRVEEEQRDRIVPAMERIVRLVMLGADGPCRGVEPPKWSVVFPSLWRPTAEQEATIGKTQAETDALYHDLGVLTPAHIARARFGGADGQHITLSKPELDALQAATARGPAAQPDAAGPGLPPAG